ncbi:uncharacterized protein LOC134830705 [Culicoides brevitarsis]|uniref:uncharacterized protein LOC134830705 n=1 Tax=Culicoides brevitarsis TaxID=469753 RepID=UPI00307C51A4
MAGTVPKIQTPPVAHLSDVDRIKLVKDYNSPSAMNRARALKALKTPTKNKRYSMFDVSHEQEEIVTQEEREAIANIKPKTIQEIFSKTRIYVEVRSGEMDHTEGIQNVVSQLGATICNTVGKTTTHVIFKDGLNSTYTKAKKMGIPIVSVLWIEACRKMLILADPAKYPISNLERYENPELFKRVRRPKVMTPKLNLTQPSRFSLSAKVTTPVTTKIVEKIEVKTEEKSDEANNTPKIPKIDRRQTIHIATPRPIVTEENLPEKTESNLWSKALDNISRVTELSKNIKTEEKSLNLFSPEIVEKPKKTEINKRRTLFTPEPLFRVNTPKTEVTKSAIVNKRRTLFTPDARPIIMPNISKSAPRRRTLLPTSPPNDVIKAKPAPLTKSTSKRKLEVDCKENTPPRPKIKPFLTPSEKLVMRGKESTTTTPGVAPTNKRRRTLYMTPEIGIKC